MRTLINQKELALILRDFVDEDDDNFERVLFEKMPDGTISALVTHKYEFDLPTDWMPG